MEREELWAMEGGGRAQGDQCERESVPREQMIQSIVQLHSQIVKLESLHPSERVNSLFVRLVALCLRDCDIDVNKHLAPDLQAIRQSLIELCGQAEGLLERHYAEIIGRFPTPLMQLHLFPYYSNYRKLALLEYNLLGQALGDTALRKVRSVAFLGSGPMPLTSMILAAHHMKRAVFHNYDIDAGANKLAAALLQLGTEGGNDDEEDIRERMEFHTCDVMDVKEGMGGHDVVFVAALVGMDGKAKERLVRHVSAHVRVGAALVVRSAHKARGFLYPVVDPSLLSSFGFDVLSLHHPSNEIVNSVIIARKPNLISPC